MTASRVLAEAETRLDLRQRFQLARSRSLRLLKAFNESDHPRGQPGNAGQFGSGGGGDSDATGGGKAPAAAAPAAAPVATAGGKKVQSITVSVAEKLGFPPERIDVVGGDSPAFGQADLTTGRITIFADAIGGTYGPALLEKMVGGTVAHEVQHQKFNALIKAAATDDAALAIVAKHKATLGARTKSGSKISDYAKETWKAAKDDKGIFVAEHETLAEMAKILHETGKLKGSPEWKAYYKDIDQWAAKNASTKAIKSADDVIEVGDDSAVFAYLTADLEPATRQKHDLVKIIEPDRVWFMPPNYWDKSDKSLRDFNPNQPRDEDGKWGSGGSSSSEAAPAPGPAPAPHVLTPEEDKSVAYYQGDKGFLKINGALRNGNTASPHVQTLDSAIAKYRTIQDVTLYRGIGHTLTDKLVAKWDERGKDDPPLTFVDKGYVSTSTSKKIAERFSKNTVELVLPKGHAALQLKGEYAGERELLLPRGSTFRVTAVRKTLAGFRRIKIELVS